MHSFEGASDDDNAALVGFRVVPPDTEGDVGPNHYVQWINLVSEIFDKNGATLVGPFAGNAYFQGLGGECENANSGDPVVLYDHLADRWLVSQFAVDTRPYLMCVAVSQTPDPTGAYYQYAFDFGNDFPDYPKLGIWGDSYTMTTRDFFSGAFFSGISAVALDRAAMLSGQPATMVRFANAFGGTAIDGYLPADHDGTATGPALFGGHGDDGDTTFELFELDVDWSNPNRASFRQITGVSISAYDGVTPGANQPNGQTLAALPYFTMHRLNVRDFSGHTSMVATHTVETNPGVLGLRWYEFRTTGGNWTLYQEGTFSPDSDDRWMGSIAINAAGDIALGYSRSSSTRFPSIYFTGQTADQSGTGVLNVAETLIHEGTGAQSGASRWGDYSALSVDPSDQATFWYTTEYYAASGSFDFNTRIASFQLSGAPGNLLPVAGFTYTANLLDVDFEDTSSDPDGGSIVAWDWDFGDGTGSTAQNPSHTYAAEGTYTVVLTVTDDGGAQGSTSQSVTVSDGVGDVHVQSIVTGSINAGQGNKTGTADVEIRDDQGSPAVGYLVTGTFGGNFNETVSATTGSNGIASLATSSAAKGGVDFCVDDVSGDLAYNASANADPTYDCTGSGGGGGGGGGTPTTLHVVSVTTGQQSVGGGYKAGKATVTLQDNLGGNPGTGYTVFGTFSGDIDQSRSGDTDGNGVATLQTSITATGKVNVDFCVSSVTADFPGSLTYEPSDSTPGTTCTAGPAAKGGEVPAGYALEQNYPNPFNPTTIIAYTLAEAGPVTLRVFNVLGREVAVLVDGYREAGPHRVAFHAPELSAGVYVYVIEAEGFKATRRMTLLK